MATITPGTVNSSINRLNSQDRAVHDWYRFVLGYPAHLVDQYLERFGSDPTHHVVFDPFCGTGTTPVEAKKQGFETISIDANPIAVFATKVKTKWNIDVHLLESENIRILADYRARLQQDGLNEIVFNSKNNSGCVKPLLSPEMASVMPAGFISPRPYAKILLLKQLIDRVAAAQVRDLYRLALAAILVEDVGNVAFGPEVYMTRPKKDAQVDVFFARKIDTMLNDLRAVRSSGLEQTRSRVSQDDARSLESLDPGSVDVVITSPPYPNEKDYTRSTRLESIVLGFIENKQHLRDIKSNLLKSNTRTIHKGDSDDSHVFKFENIQALSREIERRRMELGKTSGFERLYHRVVTHYFGGMYRHLKELKGRLRPGAQLAYVVGDQMSFFRVHIRTGSLLAEIADSLGYNVSGIDLWRERLSTSTRLMLREEVVLLRKR